MLGDAADIVCPARTRVRLVIFWEQKKSAIKNVFGMIIVTGVQKSVLVFCLPSCHFIALGMHITINEQGVIMEC
jgi:hypothetical protein